MLKQEASVKPSLKYRELESCRINHGHPGWECGTNPSHTKMATIQALLLTQRYPLSAYSQSGKKKRSICPLCHEAPETTEHFLVACQALSCARTTYIKRIMNFFPHLTDPESLAHLILQPPRFLMIHVRKLCYALHNERSYLLKNQMIKDDK